MGFYSRVIFPCLCDWLLDQPYLAEHRRALLAGAAGDVLEIGVGTGLNLPHYPAHVRKIVTVEPNSGMNKRLARRARESGVEVDQRIACGERMPVEDASFDCVVSTLTMCSIRGLDAALSEFVRVLRPGGRLLFFEHGLSPEPHVARRQRRWNWLQRRVGDGCQLDVDVRGVLAAQPFRLLEIDNFYLEKTPRMLGYIYRGTAVK